MSSRVREVRALLWPSEPLFFISAMLGLLFDRVRHARHPFVKQRVLMDSAFFHLLRSRRSEKLTGAL